MNVINANLTRMPQVTVLGMPALLTRNKVSRTTVHLGLYCYELQGDPHNPKQPIALMDQVEKGFCGTLLTPTPMLPRGIPGLFLLPGDIAMEENAQYFTPAQFEAQFNG